MPDEKNKASNVTPLKGVLASVLRQCRRDLQQDPDFLWQIWDRAVGATIARNAQPAAFKQRLLIVHVSSSVWLQELHFQKAALIERVNQTAGRMVLEDIQFKIGPLDSSR
jgi:predicted nucleic acid-binding Zn ribbon protein